jgi:hypothetical protein
MFNFGINLEVFAISSNIFHLIKFLRIIKFKLQVIQIMEINEWKNDIHVITYKLRPYLEID